MKTPTMQGNKPQTVEEQKIEQLFLVLATSSVLHHVAFLEEPMTL